MNPVYYRYRTDERFRAALIASAHRERSHVIACLAGALASWMLTLGRTHASCTDLAA